MPDPTINTAAAQQALGMLTKGVDALNKAFSGSAAVLTKSTAMFADSFRTVQNVLDGFDTTLEDYEKQLKNRSVVKKMFWTQEDNQRVAVLKSLKATSLEHEKYYTELKDLKEAGKELSDQQQKDFPIVAHRVQEFALALQEKEKELKKVDVGGSLAGTVAKNAGGIWKKILVVLGAAALVGGKDLYVSIKQQLATGIALGTHDYFRAAQLGLSPKEYVELASANRQAIIAAGGVTENFKLLEAGQQTYFKDIGDVGDTTRFVQEQMSIFAKSGIRPAITDVSLLGSSFSKLHSLLGMTGADFNAAISDVMQDESGLTQLRSVASDAERRAIIEGTSKRLAENVALGMTIEQAKETTKALNKMAGATPLDRIKQAARLRAFGGAMGIQGTDEAARILMLGQRATAEQKQQLQGVLSQMSNTLQQTATGSVGGEIFATQMADKLQLSQLLPTFNTTLAKSIEPMKAAVDTLGQINTNLTGLFQEFQTVRSTVEQGAIIAAAMLAKPAEAAGGGPLAKMLEVGIKSANDELKDLLGGTKPFQDIAAGHLKTIAENTSKQYEMMRDSNKDLVNAIQGKDQKPGEPSALLKWLNAATSYQGL